METLPSVFAIVVVLGLGVVSPGPSFVFIAQRAVSVSRRDGLFASLGMGVGGLLFAIAALLGLQTLFALFPFLYTAMKIAGGLYLIYMAVKIWRGSAKTLSLSTGADATRVHAFRSFLLGLTTQISNPKTALVYASVFASLLPARFDAAFVLLLLPAVFLIEAGWYSFVALVLSSSVPRTVYLRFKKTIDRIASLALGILGIRLLLDNEAPPK